MGKEGDTNWRPEILACKVPVTDSTPVGEDREASGSAPVSRSFPQPSVKLGQASGCIDKTGTNIPTKALTQSHLGWDSFFARASERFGVLVNNTTCLFVEAALVSNPGGREVIRLSLFSVAILCSSAELGHRKSDPQ